MNRTTTEIRKWPPKKSKQKSMPLGRMISQALVAMVGCSLPGFLPLSFGMLTSCFHVKFDFNFTSSAKSSTSTWHMNIIFELPLHHDLSYPTAICEEKKLRWQILVPVVGASPSPPFRSFAIPSGDPRKNLRMQCVWRQIFFADICLVIYRGHIFMSNSCFLMYGMGILLACLPYIPFFHFDSTSFPLKGIRCNSIAFLSWIFLSLVLFEILFFGC